MRAGIESAAALIGVDAQWLDALINFETGGTYSTTIKNPYSSARGLLQFTDVAAQGLGFKDSLSLVNSLPGFEEQMQKAVVPYLKKYAPFLSQQEFYMAVFYPAYRSMPADTVFPESVRKVNPGIVTIRDYIDFVNRRVKVSGSKLVIIALAAGAAIAILRRVL